MKMMSTSITKFQIPKLIIFLLAISSLNGKTSTSKEISSSIAFGELIDEDGIVHCAEQKNNTFCLQCEKNYYTELELPKEDIQICKQCPLIVNCVQCLNEKKCKDCKFPYYPHENVCKVRIMLFVFLAAFIAVLVVLTIIAKLEKKKTNGTEIGKIE